MTLFNTHLADRVIAAQAADNNALAVSVSVPDLRGGLGASFKTGPVPAVAPALADGWSY